MKRLFSNSFFPFSSFSVGLFMVFGSGLEAQQGASVVPAGTVRFVTTDAYQSGRARGYRQTTSNVILPDLNAILSPSPPAPVRRPAGGILKAIPVDESRLERQTGKREEKHSGERGSDNHVDPLVPVDPGYGPASPVELDPRGTGIQGKPAQSVVPPVVIPFTHQYYPRTYYIRTPYAPCPLVSFHGRGYGCYPIYTSWWGRPGRVLTGTYTSSRHYLSGMGRYGLSFGISF